MDLSATAPLWGTGASAGQLHRFLEEKPTLLDKAAGGCDVAARQTATWLGLHCTVDSCCTHSLIANAAGLIEACAHPNAAAAFDVEEAGAGVAGCGPAVRAVIKDFEAMHNVTVVHASECGSRMFGWGSADSDFDVKLVYKHPLDRYLGLRPRERVGSLEYMGWANLHTSAPVDVTIQAYDLPHFLEMVQDSNPTALDCLFSPVVWTTAGGFAADLRPLAAKHVSVAKFVQARMAVVQQTSLKHLNKQLDPKKAAKNEKKKRKGDGEAAPAPPPGAAIPQVKPKEYIIMLRSMADVALAFRACGMEEGGAGAGDAWAAGSFPPPLPFRELWDRLQARGEAVPQQVAAWVDSFLAEKNAASKYAPQNVLAPRDPAVEAFIDGAFAATYARLSCPAFLARLPRPKPIPNAVLNAFNARVLQG